MSNLCDLCLIGGVKISNTDQLWGGRWYCNRLPWWLHFAINLQKEKHVQLILITIKLINIVISNMKRNLSILITSVNRMENQMVIAK